MFIILKNYKDYFIKNDYQYKKTTNILIYYNTCFYKSIIMLINLEFISVLVILSIQDCQ
jgi:hypothetical protein